MIEHAVTRRPAGALAALALSGAVSLGSAACATVVHGGSQGIRVESVPAGADVFLGAEKKGVTPVEVKVSRKARAAVIRVEKPGYAPVTIPLERGVSAAIAWDFLFGGIQLVNQGLDSRGQMVAAAVLITLGTVGIDYLTGAAYALSPGKVSVTLEADKKPPDPAHDRNRR